MPVFLSLFSLTSEPSDVKASIAALHFIIASAGKYAVDSESLASELQQLGLPKGEVLARVSHVMCQATVWHFSSLLFFFF